MHTSISTFAPRLDPGCKQLPPAGAGYGSGAAADAGTSQGYGSGYGSMAAAGGSGSYGDTAYGSGSGYNSYQQACPVLSWSGLLLRGKDWCFYCTRRNCWSMPRTGKLYCTPLAWRVRTGPQAVTLVCLPLWCTAPAGGPVQDSGASTTVDDSGCASPRSACLACKGW